VLVWFTSPSYSATELRDQLAEDVIRKGKILESAYDANVQTFYFSVEFDGDLWLCDQSRPSFTLFVNCFSAD